MAVSREVVIEQANKLAAAGRDDDARALLQEWQKRQSKAEAKSTGSKALMFYDEPYQPSPDQPVQFDTREFTDPMRQLASGMTLGTVKAPESAARMKAEGREGLKTGAHIAGNLITGGYGAARFLGSQAVRGASIPGQIAASTGVGALEGGYTAGMYSTAQDSAGLMEDIGLGSILGIGGGALGEAATHGGRLLRRVFGGGNESAAKAKVADLMRQLGLEENQVLAEIASLGEGATLADIDDHFALLLRQSMSGNPGSVGRQVQRNYVERAEGARNRVAREVESGIDAQYTPGEVREMVRSDQIDSAGVMYKEAFDDAVVDITKHPGLGRLTKNPHVEDALRLANDRLKAADRPYGAFEVLHETRRILGQRAGSGQDMALRSHYAQLKDRMTHYLDTIADEQGFSYEEARKMYADSMQRKGALESGEKLFKGGAKDPGEVGEYFDEFSSGEADAFLAGAGQSARNRANWSSIKDPGKVFNEQNMQVLRQIMDPEDFARFEQRVAAEARKMRTSNIVATSAGLDTAGLSGAGALVYSAGGNWTALAAVAMNKVADILQGMTPRAKDEAMKLLSKAGWTTDELQELLRFHNRGVLDAGTKGVTISAGAQAGGALAEDN
jgi:hypothetical protein